MDSSSLWQISKFILLEDTDEIIDLLKKEDLQSEMSFENLSDVNEIDLKRHSFLYFKIIYGKQVAGIYCMQCLQSRTFICHAGIYKKFRGVASVIIGRDAVNYLRTVYDHATLLCFIPVTRIHVIKYAQSCGFIPIGVATQSVKIHNELQDQVILQLNLNRE